MNQKLNMKIHPGLVLLLFAHGAIGDNFIVVNDTSTLDLSQFSLIGSYNILPVENKCSITRCFESTQDNVNYHAYCFDQYCPYDSYHCLYSSGTILHFCAKFKECDLRSMDVAVYNIRTPGYVDVYAVPCKPGYFQPNERHSCFMPCSKDTSIDILPTTSLEHITPSTTSIPEDVVQPNEIKIDKDDDSSNQTDSENQPNDVEKYSGTNKTTYIVIIVIVSTGFLLLAGVLMWKYFKAAKTGEPRSQSSEMQPLQPGEPESQSAERQPLQPGVVQSESDAGSVEEKPLQPGTAPIVTNINANTVNIVSGNYSNIHLNGSGIGSEAGMDSENSDTSPSQGEEQMAPLKDVEEDETALKQVRTEC